MIKNAYLIYDAKLNGFSDRDPMFARTDGEAIRAFQQAALTEGHEFNRWAHDFSLIRVGTLSTETGHLEAQPHNDLGTARYWADLAHKDETVLGDRLENHVINFATAQQEEAS